mgnify:FL=1
MWLRTTETASRQATLVRYGYSMRYFINMKGLKGNKRRGTHTTAIGLAEMLISELRKKPGFETVQFGQIKTGGRPNGERRLKASPCPAGIALQIKEGSAVQLLVLYARQPELLMIGLRDVCKQLHVILKDEFVG